MGSKYDPAPAPRLITYKVMRSATLPNAGSRTLYFSVLLGSRSRGHKFFEPHEVPDFEGDIAWFEIDRSKGQWRFVRQVEGRT
jgi:hypothetical protein